MILLLVDGCLHWMQNILAFTLLKLVTPLTYAVANVTKRIAVITVSLLLLKNPVTVTNLGGMLMAIIGNYSLPSSASTQINSTQLQLKLRLRLALFPADPTTHLARTVVSKTSSVLLQYKLKTTQKQHQVYFKTTTRFLQD